MSEHQEQVALFTWAKMQECVMPELELLYANPLGGKRDAVTGRKLKDEGVKAGVPDVHLPEARQGYHGLWVEMKVENRKPSPAQYEWMVKLFQAGHRVVVCWDWIAAKDVIEEYLR